MKRNLKTKHEVGHQLHQKTGSRTEQSTSAHKS